MSEEEDLDLLALQRQLDDAFQTTRPRPAFEDELWLRMQSRRPIWSRFREGLAGLIEGMREAPAIPSAAVAIMLIVLVGAGIFTMSGLHFGGAGSTSSTAGSATTDHSGARGPNFASEYGALPAPSLAPAASRTAPSGGSAANLQLIGSVPASPNNIYFGPASLTWAGRVDVTATTLPVFRYQEPSADAAGQFAASLGAAPAKATPPTAPGVLGTYSGDNFTLVAIGSVAQPPQEPSFRLSEVRSASAGGAPVAVATAYLAAHSLIPTWPYQTEVQTFGSTVHVTFLRAFDVPAQGTASLIDGVGDRYGIEVDLASGPASVLAIGPLPLGLDSVDYPIISADKAVQSALASSDSSSTRVVQLTKEELVYALVVAGDHSFYEPAFLFSGTFTDQGITYVKRVLVPAVAPAFLSG
jgi:hypothetical protein